MASGRVSRGGRAGQASRALPLKRGEKFCEPGSHATEAVAEGQPCPRCQAVK